MSAESLASTFNAMDKKSSLEDLDDDSIYLDAIDRLGDEGRLKFFNNLDDDSVRANALKFFNNSYRKGIINLMDDDGRVRTLNLMTEHAQASALVSLGDSDRLKVLQLMDETSYKRAIQGLAAHAKRNIPYYGGVPQVSVAVGTFPKRFPASGKKCSVCSRPYSIGESIWCVHCRFHTFHEGCASEEDACLKCQPMTEVIIPGPKKYLQKGKPSGMSVAGITAYRDS